MEFATAASLGCRFVTSFRAIVDQGRVTPGEWVAVHGCGGVGLSAIMIASAMGANVVAIDLTDEKLDFAKKIGAVATINAARTPNVVKAVKQITNGGAHMSMDALGHPTTCFNSIANLRRRGRHVQVGLMLGDHASAAGADGQGHRLSNWKSSAATACRPTATRRHDGHDSIRQAGARKTHRQNHKPGTVNRRTNEHGQV